MFRLDDCGEQGEWGIFGARRLERHPSANHLSAIARSEPGHHPPIAVFTLI